MKRTTLIFNMICVLMIFITFIKMNGNVTQLFFLLMYGLSIGMIFNKPNVIFSNLVLVINFFLLIGGLYLTYKIFSGKTALKQLNEILTWGGLTMFLLVLTPLLNIVYAKTKMIVHGNKSNKGE